MPLASLFLLLQDAGAASDSLADALGLAVVGILVVFGALLAIGAAMTLLGRWLSEPVPAEAPAVAPPPRQAAAPAHATGEPGHVSPQTLALLTAAAVTAVGGPVRVRRVTFLGEHTVSAWKEVGRATIHASHNIRRSL